MTCGKVIVIKQLGLFCTELCKCISSELHELYLCMLHFAMVMGGCYEAIQKQMMQISSSHISQGCVRMGTINFFFYERFALHVNEGGSNVGVGSSSCFHLLFPCHLSPSYSTHNLQLSKQDLEYKRREKGAKKKEWVQNFVPLWLDMENMYFLMPTWSI